MKKLKAFTALILSFVFIFSLCSPVFAQTGENKNVELTDDFTDISVEQLDDGLVDDSYNEPDDTIEDTDSSYCSPTGDINEDECFTTADVILTLKFANKQLLPTQLQFENADVDRDGYITTNDASVILNMVSGVEKLPEHMYTEWVVTAEPTCAMNGVASCKCVLCSSTFKKIIPALGHNYQNDVCINCGEINSVKSVCYNQKTIDFGVTATELTSILGNPQEILTDGSFQIYIYSAKYTDLGIFTFKDDELTQFYSNNLSSSVLYGDEKFHLSDIYNYTEQEISESLGEIDITVYNDLNSDYAYAFLATIGEYYNFENSTDFKVYEKINFHLLNGCRAINGVHSLSYCNKARDVAYNHSADMANNNYFAHKNLEGLRCSERLTNAGIHWHYCGENIAAGITDSYSAHNGWYNSEDHRPNMLSNNFEKVGIGISYNQKSDYRYYITQNFYAE